MAEDLERLLEFASEGQARSIRAVIKAGGNISEAARSLGITRSSVQLQLNRVKGKAAMAGYAPGHFNDGVAPGYRMGKVTVQRGPGGVERVWERQHPDGIDLDAIREAVSNIATEGLQSLAPVPMPDLPLNEDLLNLYVFTDYHLGARAWAAEGGGDWDLKIAEEMIRRAFDYMIKSAPPAKVGFIGQLGDFKHFDGLSPVTPTSRHVLDSSGHYAQIVEVAVRVMMGMISTALKHHERVIVLAAEGNHDMAGSIWLRTMLKVIYRDEPRVEIVDSAKPFYAYQHGLTMLAFHHGHTVKKETLPERFADLFGEMWGRTRKRYAHCGHYHHEVALVERGGMKVVQYPTLAPNDSHSARAGYSQSWRQTMVTTYSARFGKTHDMVVTPEMLAA